jgi:hypothetical protein
VHLEDGAIEEDAHPESYPAEESQFSGFQITSVEGSAQPDRPPSPTPNYEDIVSGVADRSNGFADPPASVLGQFDENQMQQVGI